MSNEALNGNFAKRVLTNVFLNTKIINYDTKRKSRIFNEKIYF